MSKFPKIVVSPPGPKAREFLREDEKLISASYVKGYPLVVKSARGCIVKDVDDNEYIDFNSGLAVMNVGHCHPRIIEAIKTQSERLIHYSTDFYYDVLLELAKKMNKLTPGGFLKKVFYANSGTESVETAIKLAKWHTRKHRFLAFIGAFHGRTLGALSFTASKPVQQRYFSHFYLESRMYHILIVTDVHLNKHIQNAIIIVLILLMNLFFKNTSRQKKQRL